MIHGGPVSTVRGTITACALGLLVGGMVAGGAVGLSIRNQAVRLRVSGRSVSTSRLDKGMNLATAVDCGGAGIAVYGRWYR
jgi:hypothetical protein